MDRKKNESYLSFSERVTRALSNKTISYKEWAKSLLNENIYGEENTRRCFVFFEKFLSIIGCCFRQRPENRSLLCHTAVHMEKHTECLQPKALSSRRRKRYDTRSSGSRNC